MQLASGVFLGLLDESAFQASKASRSQRSANKRFGQQALADDDVRHGVDDRHVGAGQQWQVVVRLDVRRFDEVDAARIEDDQPGALAQSPFHLRGEYRVALGRVGTDHDDDVG